MVCDKEVCEDAEAEAEAKAEEAAGTDLKPEPHTILLGKKLKSARVHIFPYDLPSACREPNS